MVRIAINIPEILLEEIREYCAARDMKISAIFRIGAKKVIKNERSS